jgi:DNA-binding NarL/FixJ family response regulator
MAVRSPLIKLAIADDHQLFRKLLSGFLTRQKGIDVAIEAGDALELFSKLNDTTIDVLLLDLYMPKMNGIDAALILRNEFPHIKVIIVSLCCDLNVVRAFLDIGIYAYISKAEDPTIVLEAIAAAYENKIYKSALLTEALYSNKEAEIKRRIKKYEIALDEKEKQIIKLLWEEKSTKEISEIIYRSISSVEKIKQELKERLDVSSTAGLFRYALLNGIITLTETVESKKLVKNVK